MASENSKEIHTCKDSAIARLLVTGSVDHVSTTTTPNHTLDNEPPLDLSLTTNKSKTEPETEPPVISPGNGKLTDRKRKCSSPSDGDDHDVSHNCPYCPFVAKDMRILYNHYQLHRNILATSASAPLASVDPIHTYHKGSLIKETGSSNRPVCDTANIDNSSTLRTLLQPSTKRPGESQAASRYLKSIVQSIIKQRTPICNSGQSSRCSSGSLTPVYSSRGSSRISSPGISYKHDTPGSRIASGQDSPQSPDHLYKSPSSSENGSNNSSFETKLEHNPFGFQGAINVISPNNDDTDNNVQTYTPERSLHNGFKVARWTETRSGLYKDEDSFRVQAKQVSSLTTGGAAVDRESTRSFTPDVSPPPLTPQPMSTREVQVQCDIHAPEVDRQVADSATGDATRCRCHHCGITFDDQVIFSIHMGCHYHRNPFTCNVCGRSCENKYAFYTHIMRGHEYS